MVPPEIEAFQRLALFMKDISIVTGHLSKMMTSNYSFNDSTSRHWGKKPTAHLESWKEDHFQGKSWSYDSLSRPPTAKIQSRSPKTTDELSSRSTQPTGSQYSSKHQEETQRNKYSKSLTEADCMDNTGSEVCSGNTTVNFSLESILSPACKPNVLKDYSKEINTNTIKANRNPSIQKRTTTTNNKRTLSSNQPTTSRTSSNTNKIDTSILIKTMVNKEKQPKYKVTNSTKTIIDTTATKNEEETILLKILNYIERKINNQSISTKERVSTTLKNIATYFYNKADIYNLLNSDNHIDKLYITIRNILQKKKWCEGILNKDKSVILKYFIYSTTNRKSFYHTNENIQEIITKIQQTYTIYYK
ncbi:hypothetical protein O181_084782 [Austropuccinia psidii MF-1]|uniref:Uncharacterized protein n=1 Tax=Austropuccinia psidii MF-1 TaxID=1389203 RepID=A0A9Q3IL77_9BASI|nr:hypothetical protein [Austropuccinia psidii MF-1]